MADIRRTKTTMTQKKLWLEKWSVSAMMMMRRMTTTNQAGIISFLHILDRDQADRMDPGFWDLEEATAVQTSDLLVHGDEVFRLEVLGMS